MAQRLRAGVEADPRLPEFDQPFVHAAGFDRLRDRMGGGPGRFPGARHSRFYDVAGQKLWIVSTLAAPTPLEEMTLVGEIAKALVDRISVSGDDKTVWPARATATI